MSIHPSILKALEEIKRRELHGSTLITEIALNALVDASKDSKVKNRSEFLKELTEFGDLFTSSRPTAILLANGVRYVHRHVGQGVDKKLSVKELKGLARSRAIDFLAYVKESIEKIGEIGARRLRAHDVILTHGYSATVLSIFRRAHEEGKKIGVVVTETRPEFQGRLMARDLAKMGIPTTLVIDSGVSYFIKDVDKVLIGAEAVAANGAIVNKIGTSTIASVAHQARVRVFVAASTRKFSSETMLGELIEIEERDPYLILPREELQKLGEVTVRNPAFDVTPPEYIDLIVTEKGVIPPQGVIFILRETKTF